MNQSWDTRDRDLLNEMNLQNSAYFRVDYKVSQKLTTRLTNLGTMHEHVFFRADNLQLEKRISCSVREHYNIMPELMFPCKIKDTKKDQRMKSSFS